MQGLGDLVHQKSPMHACVGSGDQVYSVRLLLASQHALSIEKLYFKHLGPPVQPCVHVLVVEMKAPFELSGLKIVGMGDCSIPAKPCAHLFVGSGDQDYS